MQPAFHVVNYLYNNTAQTYQIFRTFLAYCLIEVCYYLQGVAYESLKVLF